MLDNMQINFGGLAEVVELGALELDIFASGNLFINTGGTNLVAHGELACMMFVIEPVFVPNPDILTVMEEFATMTGGHRTKNGAAKFGLGIDKHDWDDGAFDGR